MLRHITIFMFLLMIGCSDKPEKAAEPAASGTSAEIPELADRIKFVENYVTFRRSYDELEYDIFVKDNSGGRVPGPSDWDVRLVARVPPSELDDWVIEGKRDSAMTTPEWVSSTAQSIDADSIAEWYVDGGRSVGLDRQNNVIAYRNFAN